VSTPPPDSAQLAALVYHELRRRAAAYLRRERHAQTLQPTELAHEAYLRLARNQAIDWQGKTHFLAMAATEMRRTLVELARKRSALKRGGLTRVTLEDVMGAAWSPDILDLHHALERLEQLDPRQARVAELRIFGGLTELEVASELKVSERTVREDWRIARLWLARELTSSAAEPPA